MGKANPLSSADVINTMSAYELCHPTNLVGPIVKNFITGFDLAEVTTLRPFGVTSGKIDKTRIGKPRQLMLSDLSPDCPTYTAGDKVNKRGVNSSLDGQVAPELSSSRKKFDASEQGKLTPRSSRKKTRLVRQLAILF